MDLNSLLAIHLNYHNALDCSKSSKGLAQADSVGYEVSWCNTDLARGDCEVEVDGTRSRFIEALRALAGGFRSHSLMYCTPELYGDSTNARFLLRMVKGGHSLSRF
jgi:hypothetical protein